MTIAIALQNTINIGGKTLTENYSKTAEARIERDFDVPAGKAGTLSTRTDNDTGTLTMNAGHGLTTGIVFSLFWNVGGIPGHRRGVVAGTVVGNSVPIDGGAGDSLPAQTSVITAMIPVTKEFRVDGDDVVALGCTAAAQGLVLLTGDDDVEDFASIITAPNRLGSGSWISGNGVANPIAGDVITKVQLSHADAVSSKRMTIVIAHD